LAALVFRQENDASKERQLMNSDREHKVRERAYQIWEREGRPEGREDEHWAQAEREIESEGAAGSSSGDAATNVTAADDPTRPASGPGGAEGLSGVQSGPASGTGGARPASGAGGIASGLQGGGTAPGGGPGASQGSLGTGGGSTAGRATGSEPGRKE